MQVVITAHDQFSCLVYSTISPRLFVPRASEKKEVNGLSGLVGRGKRVLTSTISQRKVKRYTSLHLWQVRNDDLDGWKKEASPL